MEVRMSPATRLARIGALLTMILLFIGAQYGRALEGAYRNLIPLIPYVTGLAALASIIAVAVYARTKHSLRIEHLQFRRVLRAVAVALLGGLPLVALVESLIVAPIERMHFLKYSALTFFIYFSFASPKHIPRLFSAVLFAASFGSLEECAQYFHPERVYDPRDILLNGIAAVSGAVFVLVLLEWRSALRPSKQGTALGAYP
ncbi:MAG: VanZ family protein [Bdellovibrionales bacterium]|nr:VanZ family protein [Bdellovibrionales bacterium]